MKKISVLAILTVLLLASCAKEVRNDIQMHSTTVLHAEMPQTKSYLGEIYANYCPNYWAEGDVINVNGVASEPLDSEYDGSAYAEFSLEGVSSPYYCVYPSSAVLSNNNGNAKVVLPSSQKYVATSYDPSAFVMLSKDESDHINFKPAVALLHLKVEGTGSITAVSLKSMDASKPLSGCFAVNEEFDGIVASSECSDKVILQAGNPLALPAEFFVCVPAQQYEDIEVTVHGSDGGNMVKKAKFNKALSSGVMYDAPTLTYAPSYDVRPYVESITSSTAVVCWDNSPSASYKLSVYNDASCTSEKYSFTIPAADACWGDRFPRFCVSGLNAGQTYYVKVACGAIQSECEAVEFATKPFTVVVPGTVGASEGDVILAEDFSELQWDCDVIGDGAGYFPTEAGRTTSFSSVDVDSYQAATTSSEKVLSFQTDALAGSRLANWAQGANRNLYIHPGYIKLVGSKKVTHLVTPALNNIPEGKLATVKVKVTASAYYSESSAAFATTHAIVAVQTGEIAEIAGDNVNTLNLTSNVAPITLAEQTAWREYEVTLEGVCHGNRLAFGAASGVSGNDARMNISDMTVTIEKLYEEGDIEASSVGASSSSLAFSWTHPGASALDAARPYSISLYEDEDCNTLVVTHNISADESACWDGKTPVFVFGGLQASKTYYFLAVDTENDAVSQVVSATTSAFQNVDITEIDPSEVRNGDVILAEDFSEISWGEDVLMGAAGFYPSERKLMPITGEYSVADGKYAKAGDNSVRLFEATTIPDGTRLGHDWGFGGNSSTYVHPGYIRATTSASGNRTFIVTPKLCAIPEGKIAKIEVTATLCKVDASSNDVAAFVNSGNLTAACKLSTVSTSDGYAFGLESNGEWETKTIVIDNINKDKRLAIGSKENIDTKNRFNISDITIRVVELKDAPAITLSCTTRYSSSLVFTWTEGVSASDDIAKPYTISLYADASCTEMVRSFSIPANDGCFGTSQPKFILSGLQQGRDYYCKVVDTTEGAEKESAVIKATTESFSVVSLPETVQGNGIILAEDFSELIWDFDFMSGSAGFFPTSVSSFSNDTVKEFRKSGSSSEKTLKGQTTALASSRLKGWATDSNVYVHPGSLKMGTSSGKGWILTPEIPVPEGKKAIVKVTVNSRRYNSSQESNWAILVITPEQANVSGYSASFNWPDKVDGAHVSTNYQEITLNETLSRKTVSGMEVYPGGRIAFGARDGASGSKSRVFISDLTVEVTALVDAE